AADLDLAREREHVRIQARRGQRQRVDLARFAVRLRLGKDRRQVIEHVGEARRARLGHRNGHGIRFLFCLRPYILAAGGAPSMGKFVIAPHFRLQEWVAEEKGYFSAEGLQYEFSDSWATGGGKADPGKTHQTANK